MIIFPFGFYILDGKSPIYVGNDLDAKDFARAWLEANPGQVRLGLDAIGTVRISTRFLGWDEAFRSSRMDPEPLLFETTLDGAPDIGTRRLYCDYDDALAGHAEFVEIVRRRLREVR